MTDQELAEIEARATAATAGPWKLEPYACDPDRYSGISSPGETDDICCTDSNVYGPNRADAEFIIHARSDVPALVAEVRRLRKELRRLQPGDPDCRKCDGRGEYEVFDEDHGPLQSRLLECDCRQPEDT